MKNQFSMKDAQLQEVLNRKLQSKIEEGRRNSKETLELIENEGQMLTDYIAPLGKDGAISFSANGHVTMAIGGRNITKKNPSNTVPLTLHPHAAAQTADRLGLPTGYIKGLVAGNEEWQRELAAVTLNEYTDHTTRERLLIRSVGGEARGVLSDHYRRLSSPMIYASYIAAVKKEGGHIISAFSDATRSYLEVLIGETIAVPTKNNGTVFLAFGSRISSSDFGDGALDIRSFVYQPVCTNGLVTESLMRQIHLGGRIAGDFKLSERTYELDTRTQASIVSDLVKQVFSQEEIQKRAQLVQLGSAHEVDVDKEVKRLPKLGVSKGEVEGVKGILMQGRIEDGIQGKATLWSMAQAVSAVARTAEERRKRELNEIAGNLLLSVE